MTCNFRVGQKVVGIKGHGVKPTPNQAITIRANQVLTIRAIQSAKRSNGEEQIGLLFEEIRNVSVPTIYGQWELDYDARCFRPAVERGTDLGMSILRNLLNKTGKPVEVDA